MLVQRQAPPLAVATASNRDDFRRLMRSIWVLTALVLLLFGMALQRPVPAAVGVLVLLAGGVAIVWSRLSLERLSYERRWSVTRAFVGEEIEATFTVRNAKALPIPWFEARERVPDQLPPAGAHILPAAWPGAFYYTHTTALAWYERVSWRQRFVCSARGYYEVGPTRLRAGDMFGFFPREARLDQPDRITVLPRLLELGEIALPVRRPFGEAKGGNRILEDQSRLAGVRDYRPGDPLKRIDWKATARRGTLQSRLYDPSATLTLIVALNVDTFVHPWEGYDPLLLERAISVAASIAARGDEQRFAVGLVANASFPGADRPIRVAAGRDEGQLTRVLEALAMVTPFTILPPEELLARERRRLPFGASLALVAGYITPALAQQLERLRRDDLAVAVYWVGDEPPSQAPHGVPVHDVSGQLRSFEREDALAYGGEAAGGRRLVRRAI